MAVTLLKIYNLPSQYVTEAEKQTITDLIDDFRTRIYDFDSDSNILIGKVLRFTDSQVLRFLASGLKDVNRGTPKTTYTLLTFPDESLLVLSSVIVSLIAEGMLQLRNQVDYSDSGFSMAKFNKTGGFQGWAGFELQTYMQDKREFKQSLLPSSYNAGFVSIDTEFSYGM
jgi:hypothetical protein